MVFNSTFRVHLPSIFSFFTAGCTHRDNENLLVVKPTDALDVKALAAYNDATSNNNDNIDDDNILR